MRLKNTYRGLPKELYSDLLDRVWLGECDMDKLEKLIDKDLDSRSRDANLSKKGGVSTLLVNEDLAKDMGLDPKLLYSKDMALVLTGKNKIKGTEPIAQAYMGHQFGYLNMLGDGRAILLGELEVGDKLVDIQLKGSGRTIYSRGGDGKASLGPMVREYLISEAMAGLGIATTRSLAICLTGEDVFRYKREKGAVLTRIADSHIRVGTFQFAEQTGGKDMVKDLADYSIKRHYKDILDDENKSSSSNIYIEFFRRVLNRQAKLIADWMSVGFIHGVMNTDNMAISGQTIDYGPCAFMDTYRLDTVYSSIDKAGRYAYKNQPTIGAWNLSWLAHSLVDLFDQDHEKGLDIAKKELEKFHLIFHSFWFDKLKKKIGIYGSEEDDSSLLFELLTMLEKYEADYTNTFLAMTYDELDYRELTGIKNLFESDEFKAWKDTLDFRRSLDIQKSRAKENDYNNLMKQNNPVIIARNRLVEDIISGLENGGDLSELNELAGALKNPYELNQVNVKLAKKDISTPLTYRTYCGT